MTAGRPTKMTPACIKLIEQAWMLGCTDEEACLSADISRQTLNTYQQANPSFIDRKALLKTTQVLKARQVIASKLDSKTPWEALTTAKHILEKQDGKAPQKIDIAVKGIIIHRKVYELPGSAKAIDVVTPVTLSQLEQDTEAMALHELDSSSSSSLDDNVRQDKAPVQVETITTAGSSLIPSADDSSLIPSAGSSSIPLAPASINKGEAVGGTDSSETKQ